MKKIALFTVVLLLLTSMSSCKLFRTKNKCNTCPSWKAEVKQVDPLIKAV